MILEDQTGPLRQLDQQRSQRRQADAEKYRRDRT